MRLSKILGMSWENMTQRKLRTSLTTLGVVIGIAAIVGLASLGEGFRVEIRQRMQAGFELDVLIVIPGSFTTALRQPFTRSEVDSIRNVSGVSLVAPLITLPSPQAVLYNKENETINALTVAAINFTETSQMFPERFIVGEGGMPSQGENDTVVLGYKSVFPNATTPLVHVGENVTLQIRIAEPLPISKNLTLRVAAILEKGGTSGITNFDNWAFIPTNAGIELMQGREAYNLILVKVADPEQTEQVEKAVENAFENPYSIGIFAPITLIRQVDRILTIVQLFLMAVASISLLVAGIGIMNIMTVSVVERTREIGILKAIGAKSRTILGMFLAEAMMVGIIGGAMGIGTGYGLSYGFSYVLSGFIQPGQQQDSFFQNPEPLAINPIFSPEWAAIALAFAIVVCVVFGLYPARKAAKLNPVEALRYE